MKRREGRVRGHDRLVALPPLLRLVTVRSPGRGLGRDVPHHEHPHPKGAPGGRERRGRNRERALSGRDRVVRRATRRGGQTGRGRDPLVSTLAQRAQQVALRRPRDLRARQRKQRDERPVREAHARAGGVFFDERHRVVPGVEHRAQPRLLGGERPHQAPRRRLVLEDDQNRGPSLVRMGHAGEADLARGPP